MFDSCGHPGHSLKVVMRRRGAWSRPLVALSIESEFIRALIRCEAEYILYGRYLERLLNKRNECLQRPIRGKA